MFDKNPIKRITIKEILRHKFLEGAKNKKGTKMADFKTLLMKGVLRAVENKRVVNVELKKKKSLKLKNY